MITLKEVIIPQKLKIFAVYRLKCTLIDLMNIILNWRSNYLGTVFVNLNSS